MESNGALGELECWCLVPRLLANHLLSPRQYSIGGKSSSTLSMAPSKLGPLVALEDNTPIPMEVILIRLPLNMSCGDTTNPTNWEGTGLPSETGERVGEPHSCIVLWIEENVDGSLMKLELLVMRSFGNGGRATARQSRNPHLLLPLPFGEPPPPTPVGFGAPLQCPRFEPLKEIWLVAQVLKLSVPARNMVSHTSLG